MTYSQWLGKQEREWFDNRRETIRRAEDGLSKADLEWKTNKGGDITNNVGNSDPKIHGSNLPQADN